MSTTDVAQRPPHQPAARAADTAATRPPRAVRAVQAVRAVRLLRPLRAAAAVLPTVAAGVLLAVVPAAPAAAAPSPAEIAAALRESPVYVDDAYEGAVDPARQRAIARQIGKTGLPIKVALVPLAEGDDFGGDPGTLAEVLRSRIGGGDLILITASETSGFLDGFEWPGDRHQAADAVSAVGHLDAMDGAGLGAKVEKAVELIAAGNGTEVYERATADLGGSDPTPSSPPGDAADSDAGSGVPWPTVFTVAAVAILLLAALRVAVRRGALARPFSGRGGRAGAPFASPQAVFAAARANDEEELRRRAESEVVALGEAVREVEADESAHADLHAALDAYAAAGTVLDAARTRADLAGVLALVAEGRDALQAATTAQPGPAPLPLCFFNPLHGRAAHRTRWRPLGRRRHLSIAACDTCTTALRDRRPPEVLTDTLDGRDVPYFELPADRSLWAATGYGSLTKDSLATRVSRGDFTRTRG